MSIRRFTVLAPTLLIGLFLAAPAANAAGTTYYVSTAGSDSNSGTSTSAPWQSLSKLNSTTFAPGDQILLRSGDTWSGGIVLTESGAAGSPITLGAYGSGNKPLINGGGIDATVHLNGASYVTVDGLAVTNHDGADVYDGTEGNRVGIRLSNATSEIRLSNNEIYSIEGFSNNASIGSPRGTTLPADQNNLYTNGAIYQYGSGSNVTVENNYSHDNTNNGMLFTTIGSGLVIRNNTVSNVGADGIEYWNTTSPLVEHNSVIDVGNNSGTAMPGPGEIGANGAAVAGIWGVNHTGQVAQFNYAAETHRILYDGQAWDFDIGTSGGVYQYNFSRDNEGGFTLGGGPGQVYRYNVSYNDGGDQMYADQGFINANSEFYNNVFYQNNGKGFGLAKLTDARFTNNIFHTNATSATSYAKSGVTFTSNCFSGSQSAVNPGTNAVIGDAKFVNPGSVGTTINAVGGLKLQADSPCINAGVAVPGNGGRDYWGNPLYDGLPDIGAYEHTPATLGDAHSGSWSMRQLATGTPSMTGSFQTVGVAANSSYVFSAWVKGAGQQGKLVVYDSSWSVLAESVPHTSNATWRQVSTPAFNTGNRSTLIVQFIDLATTAGTTYLDDAFLGVAGGVNQLGNAGFEDGSAGWNLGAPFTAQHVVTAHGGSWALRQLNSGTPSMTGSFQSAAVDPGQTYTFSAWVRGSGQQGKLVVYDSSWSVLAESAPHTSNGTWTQVSTPSFSTGSNASLNVQFIDLGTTAGATYYDDVVLGSSGGANKLTNPGFESGNAGWTAGSPFVVDQL